MDNSEEKYEKERENRRKAPRISGIIVEYFVDGQEPSLKKAFVKDISTKGLCIYVKGDIKNGTILCLDIYLFGVEAPINPKGKVVWQKPESALNYFNVGIEFTEISDQSKKILSDHIATHEND